MYRITTISEESYQKKSTLRFNHNLPIIRVFNLSGNLGDRHVISPLFSRGSSQKPGSHTLVKQTRCTLLVLLQLLATRL